jgi:hypothetical protein
MILSLSQHLLSERDLDRLAGILVTLKGHIVYQKPSDLKGQIGLF